jgi:hypothetical protein
VPELFKQNKDLSSDRSARYSYAIFNEARLIDYSSDYQFPTLSRCAADTEAGIYPTKQERL